MVKEEKVIHFLSGNAGKLREFKALIPEIEQLKLDLDEIQSLDPKVVIEHKLEQAAAQHDGALVVEDTNLTLHAMGQLPGTYIKWFIEALSLSGIAELAAKYPVQSATARTTIGYRDTNGESHYFVGEVRGTFGWDPIFAPDGYDQTFGELGPDIKSRISMRRKAIDQLQAFLAK
jgi:inosine triphosphate pyrophosphatase